MDNEGFPDNGMSGLDAAPKMRAILTEIEARLVDIGKLLSAIERHEQRKEQP
jgi:hypothetical protein